MSTPPGLQLDGEIDESNYPALVTALNELPDPSCIHLDLSQVHYADVAFLRAIAHRVAPEDDAQTTRVVLHDIPPQLRTALRILGWENLPALRIQDGHQGC